LPDHETFVDHLVMTPRKPPRPLVLSQGFENTFIGLKVHEADAANAQDVFASRSTTAREQGLFSKLSSLTKDGNSTRAAACSTMYASK
jgi:hypothetical protein